MWMSVEEKKQCRECCNWLNCYIAYCCVVNELCHPHRWEIHPILLVMITEREYDGSSSPLHLWDQSICDLWPRRGIADIYLDSLSSLIKKKENFYKYCCCQVLRQHENLLAINYILLSWKFNFTQGTFQPFYKRRIPKLVSFGNA